MRPINMEDAVRDNIHKLAMKSYFSRMGRFARKVNLFRGTPAAQGYQIARENFYRIRGPGGLSVKGSPPKRGFAYSAAKTLLGDIAETGVKRKSIGWSKKVFDEVVARGKRIGLSGAELDNYVNKVWKQYDTMIHVGYTVGKHPIAVSAGAAIAGSGTLLGARGLLHAIKQRRFEEVPFPMQYEYSKPDRAYRIAAGTGKYDIKKGFIRDVVRWKNYIKGMKNPSTSEIRRVKRMILSLPKEKREQIRRIVNRKSGREVGFSIGGGKLRATLGDIGSVTTPLNYRQGELFGHTHPGRKAEEAFSRIVEKERPGKGRIANLANKVFSPLQRKLDTYPSLTDIKNLRSDYYRNRKLIGRQVPGVIFSPNKATVMIPKRRGIDMNQFRYSVGSYDIQKRKWGGGATPITFMVASNPWMRAAERKSREIAERMMRRGYILPWDRRVRQFKTLDFISRFNPKNVNPMMSSLNPTNLYKQITVGNKPSPTAASLGEIIVTPGRRKRRRIKVSKYNPNTGRVEIVNKRSEEEYENEFEEVWNRLDKNSQGRILRMARAAKFNGRIRRTLLRNALLGGLVGTMALWVLRRVIRHELPSGIPIAPRKIPYSRYPDLYEQQSQLTPGRQSLRDSMGWYKDSGYEKIQKGSGGIIRGAERIAGSLAQKSRRAMGFMTALKHPKGEYLRQIYGNKRIPKPKSGRWTRVKASFGPYSSKKTKEAARAIRGKKEEYRRIVDTRRAFGTPARKLPVDKQKQIQRARITGRKIGRKWERFTTGAREVGPLGAKAPAGKSPIERGYYRAGRAAGRVPGVKQALWVTRHPYLTASPFVARGLYRRKKRKERQTARRYLESQNESSVPDYLKYDNSLNLKKMIAYPKSARKTASLFGRMGRRMSRQWAKERASGRKTFNRVAYLGVLPYSVIRTATTPARMGRQPGEIYYPSR